jgi:hypothetical protein
MILHKTLTEEEVLEIVAMVVSQYLPEDIKNSDAEMQLTFKEDNSVEIYLINLPDKDDPVEGKILS